MGDFFKSIRFKVFACLAALLLGFIIYAASTGGLAAVTSQLLGFIVTPVQKAASTVTDAVTDFFDQFIHAGDYRRENIQLKEQIADYQRQLVDYEKLKDENSRLRDIAGLHAENPDFSFLGAAVIGRDPDDQFGSFMIDQGQLHGVSVNDPVVTSAGVVGKIVEVGPTFSRVITLLHPDLRISCYEITTDEVGTVSGDPVLWADGLCKFQYLDLQTDIAVGNLVVTAGSTGVFPKGLVIGTVQEIQQENNGISASAVVMPSVEIMKVKDVFVITDFLGQGESLEDAVNQEEN
ncbi:MAG TPA: rod shape-determining protein MreC [Firmicutes bacterium]|nr:rod shape-determining protein MreC [Bacillota bacterium]